MTPQKTNSLAVGGSYSTKRPGQARPPSPRCIFAPESLPATARPNVRSDRISGATVSPDRPGLGPRARPQARPHRPPRARARASPGQQGLGLGLGLGRLGRIGRLGLGLARQPLESVVTFRHPGIYSFRLHSRMQTKRINAPNGSRHPTTTFVPNANPLLRNVLSRIRRIRRTAGGGKGRKRLSDRVAPCV